MTENQIVLGRKWIAALRSGKYKQGRHRLRRGDTYCCLGVLCDIIAPNDWETVENRGGPENLWEHQQHGSTASWKIWGLVGKPIDQGHLASMNDNGKSFQEIADFLEELAPEFKQ